MLLPSTFGNRRTDGDGNVHSRRDARGAVITDPGDYIGRHRQPEPIESFLGLAAGTYARMVAVLAPWIGDRRV